MIKQLKQFAQSMKLQLGALYLASRDPGTPLLAKLIVVVVVAYALSPVDLIPDFIPLLGYLDDLLLLPLGIYLAIKLIPDETWQACLERARTGAVSLPKNRVAAAVVILCWVAILAGLLYWLWGAWPSGSQH